MHISPSFYRKIERLEPTVREAFLSLAEEVEHVRRETNAKEELEELRAVVKELAEAQKGTELRLARVEKAVEELAQAQKRTEERIDELAQAQKRTEERIDELAQAQKRTEEALETLTLEHRKTREQIGGLSATVGYRLEDEAFKALPSLLSRDHGLVIEGRLSRQYVRDNQGAMVELNIYGKARRNGEQVIILGEAKSQLSKRQVNEFLKKKLARFREVLGDVFPVLVTYMISEPDAEEYAKSKGVAVYYSYDF